MIARPDPTAVLLVELMRRGIVIQAAGDRLRFRPQCAMTPDLAARLAARQSDLLAVLAAADARGTDRTTEDQAARNEAPTPDERRLLGRCPPATLAAVSAAKSVFHWAGGATVVSVRPCPSEARDGAARLIRLARQQFGAERAATLRDAWRERLAICTVSGQLSLADAERIALRELESTLAGWQVEG